jgi:Protein of unknown function (DUF1569)
MPTIWDASVRQAMRDRIDRLTTASRPQWGKMPVAGMVAHLNDSFRMATGELAVKPKNLPFRYPPLRQLVVYLLPIPRSAPTAPELIARVTTAELAPERHDFHAWMERLGHITSGSQLVPHPAFGNLSYKEYGVLIARHADHHLKQFGV